MQPNSLLTIIIPCYNEAVNIPHVFPEIINFCEEFGYQLIAVDDGSADGTLMELKKFTNSRLTVLRHSLNRGYGAAIKTGIHNCRTLWCVTIDADGQHNLQDIRMLMAAMEEEKADLVIGNRQGLGSSLFRNLGKFIILSFTKAFFKLPITDLNSGMKLYNTRIAQSLIHWTPNGMAFSDVVTLIHYQLRYKIVERNITINARTRGQSTINWRTAVYTISEIAFLVVNVIPFKFFGTLSLLLFLLGIIWGLPFALEGEGVTVGSALIFTTALIVLLQGMMMELLVRLKYQNYIYPIDKQTKINDGYPTHV
jgi:glycosyltransferase involved in cell wall biosynthesis